MRDLVRKIVEDASGEVRRHFGNHSWRLVRVMAVGGVGFIIAASIFEIVGIRMQLVAASTASLIAGECAILSNFFLNDRFSFGEMAAHAESLISRIVRFHLVSSGSLATQWIIVFITESFTSDPLFLRGAFVLGVGIGFIFNYTGYYLWVWRKRT